MSLPPPGHDTADLTIQTELKLFTPLAGHTCAPLEPQVITIAAGSTVGDLLRKIELPARRVFLAFIDGHDITPRLEGGIESDHPLQDGDVVALSRPIPYSWGYGSPVV